ncbi:hypothetical protein D3C75_973970 [compost metagenome]
MFVQAGQLALNALIDAGKQLQLSVGNIRCLLSDLWRQGQRSGIAKLGGQTQDPRLKRQLIGLGLPGVRTEAGIIQAQQRCPGFNHLPFVDEDLSDYPPFEVLYFLQARRGNSPPFAARHLINIRQRGPENHRNKESEDCPQGHANHAWGVIQQGFIDLIGGKGCGLFVS